MKHSTFCKRILSISSSHYIYTQHSFSTCVTIALCVCVCVSFRYFLNIKNISGVMVYEYYMKASEFC